MSSHVRHPDVVRREKEHEQQERERQRERAREPAEPRRRRARTWTERIASPPRPPIPRAGKGMPTPPGPLVVALIGPELPPGALCKGRAPFWDADVPGETDAERTARLDAAREVCQRCPVREPCERAGAEGKAAAGMWGGVLYRRTRK